MQLARIITASALASALLSPGNDFAENPRESTIGMKPYKALFEGQGPSKKIPKVLVYSSRGKCVGITTGEQTLAGNLPSFIRNSLLADKRACDLTLSDKFPGGLAIGGTGTGAPAAVFVLLKADVCPACNDYREQAQELASSGIQISIVNLDLSTQSNPVAPADKRKPCPACDIATQQRGP